MAINLLSEKGDQLACFVWRSNGVPKVCRSFGVSEMATDWQGECDKNWRALCGDQMACRKWHSTGVSDVAIDRIHKVWRSLYVL